MINRPACYPPAPSALLQPIGSDRLPGLDVLTTPVPTGVFNSPVDWRHVLCLHVGQPVPVSYRAGRYERQGTRLHGQFCVVPAESSTRWIVSRPATSLLLRLTPALWRDTADAMQPNARDVELAPAIHIRDAQIERIGAMMHAEARDAYPGGRIFADSLATALAARLLALQAHAAPPAAPARALPAWRLHHVIDYIEAHLDTDLTLAELAAVAQFSVSHFKALFRAAAGMPVHRFVLERRIARARARLAEGTMSMAEIAADAGFAHASHMARCLRRATGLSPAQLRPHG